MNEAITHAINVVEKLQEWIEARDGLSSTPIASVTWSPYTMTICIADICVYDDQHSEGDLRLDACKREWLSYVDGLKSFQTRLTLNACMIY